MYKVIFMYISNMDNVVDVENYYFGEIVFKERYKKIL